MKNKIKIFIVLFICLNVCLANEPNNPTQVRNIIEKLNQAAANLKNLTAEVEYLHAQSLFDTQTLRTGELFYTKDANFCALRINFLTLKQDESQQQNYREDYIFDGMKLTKIDYQGKSALTEQYAREKTIEPFELVQDYFPIIGLSKPDEMAEQFDITADGNTLLLTPKENSKFFKTYKQVKLTVNSENYLPSNFWASTCDSEEITIKLSKIENSKAVDKNVFEVKIPADFVQTQK